MTKKPPEDPPRKPRKRGYRERMRCRAYANRGVSTRISRCNKVDAINYCACEAMSGLGPTAIARELTAQGIKTTRQAVFNWRRWGVPLHLVNRVAKMFGVPRGLLSPTHFGHCDCWKYGKLLEMSGLANKE